MFSVCVHGGAGVIAKTLNGQGYYASLQLIMEKVWFFCMKNLENDRITALDVAEYAVCLLEDDELYNAGKGAVFTTNGEHELEASIMNGEDLKCGAVSLVKTIKNPISLARLVLQHSKHTYLVGDSALSLADTYGLEKVEPSYYSTANRWKQLETARNADTVVNDHDLQTNNAMGTVGAVVMYRGHVAAATSTGGMTNKQPGRIGDTPIIGAGTYASDTTCAVSCTGKGEEFMRRIVAYDVSAQMQYGNKSLQDAAKCTVANLPPECGGVIAVNAAGDVVMEFNSLGMFRASVSSDGIARVGIWEDMLEVQMPPV